MLYGSIMLKCYIHHCATYNMEIDSFFSRERTTKIDRTFPLMNHVCYR